MTRESRKIFRFFSTIQEIKRICFKLKDLQWKNDKTIILLDVISRIGYLIYWGFDNLYVISVLRNVPRKQQFKYIYISNVGWFFGNLISIIKNLFDLVILLKKSEEGQNHLKYSNTNNSLNFNNNHIFNTEDIMLNINYQINNNIKEIIARTADLIISTHYIGIPQWLFNFKLNDLIISICGLTSACIW